MKVKTIPGLVGPGMPPELQPKATYTKTRILSTSAPIKGLVQSIMTARIMHPHHQGGP